MKKLFAFLLFLLPWPALAQQIGPVGAISINVTSVTGGTNGDCLTITNGKLGQTASCGAAAGLTVGTSTITGGATTRILYDNAGVLGEYTLSGSGTVVAMATSPVFTTPTLGVAGGTSLALGGATIGTDALAWTGTATGSGNLTLLSSKIIFGNGSGSTGVLKFSGGNANFRNFADSANAPVIASIFATTQVAATAGGTTAAGFVGTSITNFGMFFGSGAPTFSTAQGSLYLRSDGPPQFNNNGTTGYSEIVGAIAVNTVSPTSPNRTIQVSLGGTTYYIAAKTTND